MLSDKELDKVVGGTGVNVENNTAHGDVHNVNNGDRNQNQVNSGIVNGGQNDASVHVENSAGSTVTGGKIVTTGANSQVTINL